MNLPLAILLACSPRLGAAEPLETLVGRTQADGAPLAARTEAVRLMRGMLGEADPDVVRRLVSNGAYVVVVPEGIRMTSRPEFARFAGLLTFDGRPWNEVRGIGYAPTPRGLAMGVGAENLLGRGVYAPGHTFVHEFAHLLEVSGLAPDMRRRVEEAYRVPPPARRDRAGPLREQERERGVRRGHRRVLLGPAQGAGRRRGLA